MKNRFDLIVFDWDGTLINTIDWIVHCLQEAGRCHGFAVPEPQAAKDVIGLCIDNAVAALYPEANPDIRKQIVGSYSQTYFSRRLSQDDFFPGVRDMLEQLKSAGYILAVATGKTRHGLEEVMAATQTESFFAVTRCADETASKPNPLMLHEIMDVTQTLPERTLMVGDSIHDMDMARNANIFSVGVTCGANDQTALSKYGPLLCLEKPTELLSFIS